MQNRVHEEKTTQEKKNGGIQNLRQRLKILYGNDYELYTQQGGQYFTAQLKIPVELWYHDALENMNHSEFCCTRPIGAFLKFGMTHVMFLFSLYLVLLSLKFPASARYWAAPAQSPNRAI